MSKVGALVRTWLLIDFFGEARRAGKGHASSLTTTIFTQSFLAFVFAALLYPETPPVPFAAANLCLSSLLMAIGALGDESRPERRAADDLLLVASPLSSLTIAIARAGHAAFALLLVTAGMALPPAILLVCLTGQLWQGFAYAAGACACSALAAAALGVVARAAARWLGGGRAVLLTGSLRALLLGGGLVLFALGLPRLQGTAAGMPIGEGGLAVLPPYHVARWLAAPADEAWRLLALLAAGAVLLLLTVLLGDRGRVGLGRRSRAGWSLRLLRRLTRPGPSRAVAEFVAVSMWRSPGFRSRVLPLLGVPAAMVFLALRGERSDRDFVLASVVLQLPAIYLPFLVVFLPRADQPGAAWVFEHAPRLSRALVRDATWRALVTHVLAPVFAGAALLAVVAGAGTGAWALLAAIVFAAGLAIVAARAAAMQLETMPFTVAKEAGNGPELGGLFASAIVLGGAGIAFGALLPPPWQWPVAAAVLASGVFQLARRRPPADDESVFAADTPRGETVENAATDGAQPAGRPQDRSGAPLPAAGLARELRAIAVLYAFACILPLLVGTLFAS
jgi:hypothetical protein